MGTDSGKVYVYHFRETVWTPIQTLKGAQESNNLLWSELIISAISRWVGSLYLAIGSVPIHMLK